MRTAIVLSLAFLLGCTNMSESVKDPSIGINGGFEFEKNDIPINWLVYSPRTVPDGEFSISFDNVDKIEGNQSLRMDILNCDTTGGWLSPGIAQEFPKMQGQRFRASIWIKSIESKYQVKFDRVNELEAQEINSWKGANHDWQKIEREITLTDPFDKFRIEINGLASGTLWIDHFAMEMLD
ncbi:MAG: hypothetical protein JXQ90_02485 [Cyclobacteriaceae bacterium]